MKIAIPLLKNRVAPHFGSTSEMLLLEIRNNSIYNEAKWNVGGETPLEIARKLVELGVEQVICGGIGSVYKEWLVSKGVDVRDNVRGDAREIIKELIMKTTE